LIEAMTREPHVSERTCIVTRRRGAPEAMIRFVRGPDGALAPDIAARLPGRGVWVTGRADLVAQAARKHLFARSLKTSVNADPQLAEDVDRLLEADCLRMLSLANKAGAVMAGFGKVADALAQGGVGALIEARDGGEDGRRKLAQAARRAESTAPVIGLFASLQLDLALGRTNVIHAALAEGGASTAFIARCRRLAAYRGVCLGGAAASGEDIEASPNGGAREG
jgi:predicted RNA-binding protein YlxR (DUF448 family)